MPVNEHREICVCFHVSANKIRKHIRLNKIKVPSQISECYGAGTGCGWCIPFLEKIFESEKNGTDLNLAMSEEEYRERRCSYQNTQTKNQFSK